MSLHNSIFQATLAFMKGTSNFACEYSYEKLQDLLNLIINAMKINTYYDYDTEFKDQAKVIMVSFPKRMHVKFLNWFSRHLFIHASTLMMI